MILGCGNKKIFDSKYPQSKFDYYDVNWIIEQIKSDTQILAKHNVDIDLKDGLIKTSIIKPSSKQINKIVNSNKSL